MARKLRNYKKYLGKIGSYKVFIVNSKIVGKLFDPRWNSKWPSLGGHHFGAETNYIPKNELWVSNKSKRIFQDVAHEWVEA